MSLDCKDPLIPFYKTLGYKLEPGNANSMMLRFPDPSTIINENPSWQLAANAVNTKSKL